MATKPTKRKKSEEGGISLLEFRAWLQGIEEMQDDTWAPNTEQWKKIKAKIADIVEEEIEVPTNTTNFGYGGGTATSRANGQVGYGGGAAPARVSELPAAPRLQQQPISNPNPAKTPDIDSSNGYISSLV